MAGWGLFTASWLIVTRQLPDALRAQLGLPPVQTTAPPINVEAEEAIVAGEVLESDEEDEEEEAGLDASVIRAVALGLRARR